MKDRTFARISALALVTGLILLLTSLPATAAKASSKPSGGSTSRPAIKLISATPAGAVGNNYSMNPDITPDGRYIAFFSYASNLVAGDTNGTVDSFVRDRSTGITERVSLSPSAAQLPKGGAYPSISADGRFVAFASSDPSLNPPSLMPDLGLIQPPLSVFIRDRQLGTTTLVSRNNDTGARVEGSHPSISDNGCRVAYETSDYSYLYDCTTGKVSRVGAAGAYEPAISGDGRFVAYTVYDPGTSSVHRLEIATGITQFVGVNNAGESANSDTVQPDISRDGNKVVFTSWATNMGGGTYGGVFLRDLTAGTTKIVSVNSSGQPAESTSRYASLSPDATHVAFVTSARNLITNPNGLQQVYLHTLATGQTILLSYVQSGKPSSGHSHYPSTSASGAVVAFDSDAPDLVSGDTNNTYDVFAAIK